MKIQEVLLALCEAADVGDFAHVNTHPVERGLVRHRGNYQRTIILEANKTTVEQMIDGRR